MPDCKTDKRCYNGSIIIDNGFVERDCTDECIAGENAEFFIITDGEFDEIIFLLPATGVYTINPIAVDAWIHADNADSGIRVWGNAGTGTSRHVYSISNACGEWHIVINITKTETCAPPSNVIYHISANNGRVSEQVNLVEGSKLSGLANNSNLTTSVAANILYISGNVDSSTTYTVPITSPCGDYTVSGDIKLCQQITVLSTEGSTVFEKGTPVNFKWLLSDTAIIVGVDDVPNGLSVTTVDNTVSITGTPSDNTGSGDITVKIKNKCSSLNLSTSFSQAECKVVTVVADTGNSVIKVGDAATFGKVLGGKTPITLVGYTGIPKGLAVQLLEANGVYSIQISGTVAIDPCAASDTGTKCDEATVTVKNECGELAVPIAYSLSTLQTPTYCIGVYEWVDAGATGTLKVYGILANSDVTISKGTPTKLTVNAAGFGEIVVTKDNTSECPSITHATCALVKKEVIVVC